MANLSCRVAFFCFMLAVIKQMPTVEYGRVTYFMSMGNSITSIASGGLGTLLVANLGRYDDSVSRQKLFAYSITFLVFSVLIMPSIYQAIFDSEFSLLLIVIYTMCLCAKTLGESSLLGMMRTRSYFIARISEGLVYLLGLFLVMFQITNFSINLTFVVAVVLLATFPSILMNNTYKFLPSLSYFLKSFRTINENYAGIAQKHFFLFVSQVVAAPGIFILLDQVKKSHLNADFELGVYGAFYQWYAPLVMLTGVLSNAFLPLLVGKKTQITNKQLILVSCVCIFIIVGILLILSPVITSFYGPDYYERLFLFKLMMLAAGMHALNNVMNSLILATFSEKITLVFEVLWVSVLLFFGLLLISDFGVQAVVTSILIAYSVVVFGKKVLLVKYANV